jgi:hypothetical protein
MTLDEIIDRLYGLPLAEFTQARNAAASELRKAGQREAAAQVKALRRPTVGAGAVNRLVREHRAEVEQFLRAAAELRDAQFSGEGDLAAARREERDALAELVRLGGGPVRQTLLAAAVDDDAARLLLEARLERELEPRGFGTLLAHAPAAPARPRRAAAAREAPARSKPETTGTKGPEAGAPRSAPAKKKRPDDGAARARLEDAEEALRGAEAEERQARRHWDETRRELEKAQAAVERARRNLDRLREEGEGR